MGKSSQSRGESQQTLTMHDLELGLGPVPHSHRWVASALY